MTKKLLVFLLVMVLLLQCGCVKQPALVLTSEPESVQTSEPATEQTSEQAYQSQETEHLKLERDDWADDVKLALNDLLATYGKDGVTPAKTPYVVFDFDNTSSIFDVEEQLAIYQLQVMAFAVNPQELRDVLLTGLNDTDKDLTDLGYGKGSINDWVDDICSAYMVLWDKYGEFTAKGVPADRLDEMHADIQWQEFSAKMRTLYNLIYEVESSNVAYPWITYWFTGMTEDEIFDLATEAFDKYKDVETSVEVWTSPSDIESKTGIVSVEWTSGIQVSDNIRELWKALDENGIDVWVCSASCTGAIRAAIDTFGFHDYCKGMLAMTNKTDENGRYLAQYDMETGCGYYAGENGLWTRMPRPTKSQTQGKGKVTAIVNAIAPEYDNHGPLAGFMDSTGDFNFCTEFESLKLVVCINRANRKVTDGGGLIAEVAMYEKETLGYDLAKANNAGDTLYVLQGRDENGKRSFRNSNRTIRFGEKGETLFKNSDNEAQLQRMIDEKMTVSDILNTYAIRQDAGENGFDFNTGFLDKYDGYHSIKE